MRLPALLAFALFASFTAAFAQSRGVCSVRSGPSALSLNGPRHFNYVVGAEIDAPCTVHPFEPPYHSHDQ